MVDYIIRKLKAKEIGLDGLCVIGVILSMIYVAIWVYRQIPAH